MLAWSAEATPPQGDHPTAADDLVARDLGRDQVIVNPGKGCRSVSSIDNILPEVRASAKAFGAPLEAHARLPRGDERIE